MGTTINSLLSHAIEAASHVLVPSAEHRSLTKPMVKPRGEEEKAEQENPTLLTERINKLLAQANSRLSIKVDKETAKVIYQILDSETGEILRQVPPEELLRLAAHMAKLSTGNLINTKV